MTVVAKYNFYIYTKTIATEYSNPKGMVSRNEKCHGTLFYESSFKESGIEHSPFHLNKSNDKSRMQWES